MSDDDNVQVQIDEIIDKLNEIQIVMSNLASKTQLNQSVYIRQGEVDNLNRRVTALEQGTVSGLVTSGLNVVIGNLATKAQLNQLSYVRQNEIDDLQTRVTNLESEIAVLQNS